MIFNSNISKRESDVNLSDATATSSDIISGKTAYGSTGKIVGTLVPGTDTSDATATSNDILYGKTAYIASGKATGSMLNRGAVTASLSAGGSYTIPSGYHNGSGKVTANSLSSQTSGTATASDIASGKTAWVNGSKLTGTKAETPVKQSTITFKNNTSYYLTYYYTNQNNVANEYTVDKNSTITLPVYGSFAAIGVGGTTAVRLHVTSSDNNNTTPIQALNYGIVEIISSGTYTITISPYS